MNVKDIGRFVCDVTDKYGYFPDRNYCGHGIGRVFHSNPSIHHTRRMSIVIESNKILIFTFFKKRIIARQSQCGQSSSWTGVYD